MVTSRSRYASTLLNDRLHERFYCEAQSLYDAQQGRLSLPTVQALAIMSVYLTQTCRDRTGTLLRMTAYALLKQLNLERKYTVLAGGAAKSPHEVSVILNTRYVQTVFRIVLDTLERIADQLRQGTEGRHLCAGFVSRVIWTRITSDIVEPCFMSVLRLPVTQQID